MRTLFSLSLVLAIVAPATLQAAPMRFTVSPIVAPDGRMATRAYDINASGQITVLFDDEPFLYDHGTVTRRSGMDGKVNDAGQGSWLGINNAGQTLGYTDIDYRLPDGRNFPTGTLTTNGVVTVLGLNDNSIAAYPTALNNRGDVVGHFYRNDGNKVGFLYRDGKMAVIPPPAGESHISVNAINDHGQVVGGYFYGDTDAFIYENGVTRSLGSLGGPKGIALDINNLGQIVGTSDLNPSGGSPGAFLYMDGTMWSLQDLIPTDSGWLLESALAINDSGEIIGHGSYNGERWAFLLSPTTVPEPSTLLLFMTAVVMLLIRGSRSRITT